MPVIFLGNGSILCLHSDVLNGSSGIIICILNYWVQIVGAAIGAIDSALQKRFSLCNWEPPRRWMRCFTKVRGIMFLGGRIAPGQL